MYYNKLISNCTNNCCKQGTISNLGQIVGGSTPSKQHDEYYTKTGIPWITPKDLSVMQTKFISHGNIDITELGMKNSSVFLMPRGTVIFSSRAPIGYIAIANCPLTTNQGFKSVIPFKNIGTPFVYYFLKNNVALIENMASGSTFKEVSGSTMKSIPVRIPVKEIIDRFNMLCEPILAQQEFIENENKKLTILKKSLLPKLMSGEIDVSNIKI